MDYSEIVRSELLQRGLNFIEEYDAFQFTMSSGQRRWRTLLSTENNALICCAQFPWISGGCLKTLNQLNAETALGCFLLTEGRVVFRCGAEVFDPLTAGETAISLLRLSGNTVCRYWERVRFCGGTDEL